MAIVVPSVACIANLKVDIDVAHRHVVDLLPTELVTRIPITSTQIGRLHHRCDVRRPR